ncbi:hypothetical protein AAFF_G00317100 [Aldrovandia affinis]|uniref:Uncharacterized protein n=1 Tax=Aldrovandia affinis TaxID=143900 RepID=A0AAD7W0J1_9TELE|nr:hypothetical protein AAFF_G00317100 [Aldrovandia affinis]
MGIVGRVALFLITGFWVTGSLLTMNLQKNSAEQKQHSPLPAPFPLCVRAAPATFRSAEWEERNGSRFPGASGNRGESGAAVRARWGTVTPPGARRDVLSPQRRCDRRRLTAPARMWTRRKVPDSRGVLWRSLNRAALSLTPWGSACLKEGRLGDWLSAPLV